MFSVDFSDGQRLRLTTRLLGCLISAYSVLGVCGVVRRMSFLILFS